MRFVAVLIAVLCLLPACGRKPAPAQTPSLPATAASLPGPPAADGRRGPGVEPAYDVSDETLHFVVYGESQARPDQHSRIAEQIDQFAPELVLHTGGLVTEPDNAAMWRQSLEAIEPLRLTGEYLVAVGSQHPGREALLQDLDLPLRSDGLYYSVVRNGCRFLMLDSTALRQPGGDPAQVAWLTGLLDTAQENHFFVVMHHPPFSIGGAAPGDAAVRETLHPLFRSHDVRAVFCGGDRGYYRTERDGVLYLVTGGGGAPLHELDPGRVQPGDGWAKKLHFIDTTAVGWDITVEAIDADGQVFDSFTRSASPEGAPKATRPGELAPAEDS